MQRVELDPAYVDHCLRRVKAPDCDPGSFPEYSKTLIVYWMSQGLPLSVIPAKLNMLDEDFDVMIDENPYLYDAIELGQQKMRLYLEQLALKSAKTNSAVLLALLRERLGMDIRDKEGKSVIVEVNKFVQGKEGKENPDPK